MLKGHTKIELHNVKTGQNRVVESDNMITNASKWLYYNFPTGGVRRSLGFNSHSIDRFFGGILLFSDTINEDVDNFYIPEENQMVGNGEYSFASTSEVAELGSINTTESSYSIDIDKGTAVRKYVYDFSTAQGNGTISSVSLTNPLVGYCGVGNHSGKNEKNLYSGAFVLNRYFSSTFPIGLLENTIYDSSHYIAPLFADYSTGKMYAFDLTEPVNSGKLILGEITLPFKGVSPFEFPFCTSGDDDPSKNNTNLINKKIELTIPDGIVTNNTYYSVTCGYNSVLMVFGSASYIDVGSVFYAVEINRDLTITGYKLSNTTGVKIYIGSQSEINVMGYKNGYLYVKSYERPSSFYKMKLSDSTDVSALYKTDGTYMFDVSPYRSRFYLMGGNVCFHISDTDGDRMYMVNSSENLICPLNGYPNLHNNMEIKKEASTNIVKIFGSPFIICSYDSSLTHLSVSDCAYYGVDPFMLSTINNLDTPVTKTSDMTMKITYTITGSI